MLLQQSNAPQVRLMTCGQEPLVTVLITPMVTLVPQQKSKTKGVSKVQAVPHTTVLFVQNRPGGMLSRLVTYSVKVLKLLQQSVAFQVREMTGGQAVPLVSVEATVM